MRHRAQLQPHAAADLQPTATREVPDQSGAAARLMRHRQLADQSPPIAQLNQHSARMAAASRPTVQKVDLPPDSQGNIDRVMATSTNEEGETEEITGTKLQEDIIEMARAATEQHAGGYRLGTYRFDPGLELPRIDDPGPENHGMPALPEGFDTAALDQLVVPLVLGILDDSGQLAYLLQNWGAIFITHHVVVDVDCQFNRHQGSLGFHKDSRGTTVFFNLSYSNPEPMQGPDYYRDVRGVPELERKLPAVVTDDLYDRRLSELEEGITTIESPKLDPNGRVSLSDPNRYHSTPKLGHRTVLDRDEQIARAVAEYGEEYRDAFTEASDEELYPYIADAEPYNNHNAESAELEPELASMSYMASKRERRLSKALEDGTTTQQELDQQAQMERTFIRSWVRMIPRT